MLGAMLSCFSPEQRALLLRARVGIAGAGGLGSNAAMMLARSGIGCLVLIDGDTVDASNLNRQHFMPRHLGRPKVEALAEQLRELRPDMDVVTHHRWLDRENIAQFLPEAELWLEAMDDAAMKAMFVSAVLRAGKPVIGASGMGGFGSRAMERHIMRTSRSVAAVVGDFSSDVAQLPPLAPRVVQCAAMQADAALEWLLTGKLQPLL
ncbi:sulfur carrier protein ThiS adenylyltransferase ThiF [Mailhella sp.]|uniref:sulfur carrier protein ThiS adenylyltransferase ThiF n=1 Tax=Mailhella sp. TaxID=1981029 RepID=UPI004063E836